MPQFRLDQEILPQENRFTLLGPEAGHALRVLRYKTGDKILCLDPAGTKIEGLIEEIGEDLIKGSIVNRWPFKDSSIKINLYASILKTQAWEEILEKGTEIGVAAFMPVLSDYSAITLKKEDYPRKMERWKKVILSAVKQSERDSIPELNYPRALDEILGQDLKGDVFLFAWEKLRGNPDRDFDLELLFKNLNLQSFAINLWIGPEGGFSEKEVELFLKRNVKPFSLGDHILRAETAAVVACAQVEYQAKRALLLKSPLG
jgi:16S rRNA (uracil1498-N3)-methyltransferase